MMIDTELLTEWKRRADPQTILPEHTIILALVAEVVRLTTTTRLAEATTDDDLIARARNWQGNIDIDPADLIDELAAALTTSRQAADERLAEARDKALEEAATVADAKRDEGLNMDLTVEPMLWADGYEHGCHDVAKAIRERATYHEAIASNSVIDLLRNSDKKIAELEGRLADARKAALEEAAQWHDKQAAIAATRHSELERHGTGWREWKNREDAHKTYAKEIRALRSPTVSGEDKS